MTTLIDVGANSGQFSLLARFLHPAVKIIAFEPLNRPAQRFQRLFSSDALTTLHQLAIGAQNTTTAGMNVAGRDDSSSLLPITAEQERFAPGTAAVGVEQVTIRRLDEVVSAANITRPSMLKLDVQGYELSALRSCGALLDQMDYVYVEVSFVVLYQGQALADEIVQFLFSSGFSFAGANSPSFDDKGRCMQADFLFRRTGSNDVKL